MIRDPGSRINLPDHISRSWVTILWVKKYLNSLVRIRIRDPLSFLPWIRDADPGKHSRSATLSVIHDTVNRIETRTLVQPCHCVVHPNKYAITPIPDGSVIVNFLKIRHDTDSVHLSLCSRIILFYFQEAS